MRRNSNNLKHNPPFTLECFETGIFDKKCPDFEFDTCGECYKRVAC